MFSIYSLLIPNDSSGIVIEYIVSCFVSCPFSSISTQFEELLNKSSGVYPAHPLLLIPIIESPKNPSLYLNDTPASLNPTAVS